MRSTVFAATIALLSLIEGTFGKIDRWSPRSKQSSVSRRVLFRIYLSGSVTCFAICAAWFRSPVIGSLRESRL
jgi:hypothetical protein